MSSRYSWEEVYINIAKVVAKRSEDPHTKVGACLVKDRCVIGIGYNGAPRGYKGSIPWFTQEKHKFVIHAEMNAIANAQSVGVSVVGADLYLTLSPCHECIKLLIQNRIKNVYYLEEYKDIKTTKMIAENANINLRRIKL